MARLDACPTNRLQGKISWSFTFERRAVVTCLVFCCKCSELCLIIDWWTRFLFVVHSSHVYLQFSEAIGRRLWRDLNALHIRVEKIRIESLEVSFLLLLLLFQAAVTIIYLSQRLLKATFLCSGFDVNFNEFCIISLANERQLHRPLPLAAQNYSFLYRIRRSTFWQI